MKYPVLKYLNDLKRLHDRLRKELLNNRSGYGYDGVQPVRKGVGDFTYACDAEAEKIVLEFCRALGKEETFVLVSEDGGSIVFPEGGRIEDAAFTLIIDPIDGTRGLMYGMRSAWILTCIAKKGANAHLADCVTAYQSEIPLVNQHIYEALSWTSEGLLEAEVLRVSDGSLISKYRPESSKDKSLAHGFAFFSKFFLEGKSRIAEIEQKFFERVLKKDEKGYPLLFDDQYICCGGQLYLLATGRYRFVADVRPFIRAGLCSHAYDMCTADIARAAGAVLTDLRGKELDFPLDAEYNVGFIGYANNDLRNMMEPVLMELLDEYGG